jgi:hypothetical protein
MWCKRRPSGAQVALKWRLARVESVSRGVLIDLAEPTLDLPTTSIDARSIASANRLNPDSLDSDHAEVCRSPIPRRNPKKFFAPRFRPSRRDFRRSPAPLHARDARLRACSRADATRASCPHFTRVSCIGETCAMISRSSRNSSVRLTRRSLRRASRWWRRECVSTLL